MLLKYLCNGRLHKIKKASKFSLLHINCSVAVGDNRFYFTIGEMITPEIIERLNLVPLEDEINAYQWPALSKEDEFISYIIQDEQKRFKVRTESKTHWSEITFAIELLIDESAETLIKNMAMSNYERVKRKH